MRIHTNENTMSNIMDAAKIARVNLDVLESHNSRTHDAAFEVILSGESRRRQNTGKSSRDREFAATWDQWGVFLSVLFNIDPDMRCGISKRPFYANAADFEKKTDGRFVNGVWPDDAHGDHKFRWDGLSSKCTKCSARRVF